MRTVADVARAVSRGEADADVLPVENIIAGGVVAAYDAIANAPDLHVIAEAILGIHQCLMAAAGTTLDRIEVVESHPVALAQCALFLARLPLIRQEAAFDTAGAVRAVAEARDPRRAAIASQHAAALHWLMVLADHIEDRPHNQTRFLAVARAPVHITTTKTTQTCRILGTYARALS